MAILLQDLFTGTNGAAWDAAKWANQYFQFGGTGDIQGNRGHQVTGINGGGTDYGGIMTAATYDNFGLYVEQEVVGSGTNSQFTLLSFRSNSTWENGLMTGQGSYYVKFLKDANPGHIILAQWIYTVGGSYEQQLGSFAYTFTNGDIVKTRIRASGSSLQVTVWKNSEAEPGSPQLDVVDTMYTSGVAALAIHSGPSSTADVVYWDTFEIDDLTVAPPTAATGGGLEFGSERSFIGEAWFGAPDVSIVAEFGFLFGSELSHIGSSYFGAQQFAEPDTTNILILFRWGLIAWQTKALILPPGTGRDVKIERMVETVRLPYYSPSAGKVYVRTGGVWVLNTVQPSVRVSGSWVTATHVHVRISGAWVQVQ